MDKRLKEKLGFSLIIALLATAGVIFFTDRAYSEEERTTKKLQEVKSLESTQLPTAVVPVITRPRIDYKAENLRDPFQGRIREGEAVDQGPPDIEVSGLVWGGVFPQAIIKGKVLKVGDMVENVKIIDISKDGVTVLSGGRQYTLPSPGIAELKKIEEKQKGGKSDEKK